MIRVRAGDTTYLCRNTGDVSRLLHLADDDELAATPVENLSELYAAWSGNGRNGSVEMANRVRHLVTFGRIPYFTFRSKEYTYLCAGHGPRGQLLSRYGRSDSELLKDCLISKYGDGGVDLNRLPENLRGEARPLLRELLRSPKLVQIRREEYGSDSQNPGMGMSSNTVHMSRSHWDLLSEEEVTPVRTYQNKKIPFPMDKRWYEVDGGRALLYGCQKTARTLRSKGHWVRPCESAGTPLYGNAVTHPLCGKEWVRGLQTLLEMFPELPNPFRKPLKPDIHVSHSDALGQDVLILLGDRELIP